LVELLLQSWFGGAGALPNTPLISIRSIGTKGGLLSLIISPDWSWEIYYLYRPGLKPLTLPVVVTPCRYFNSQFS
jgi:hypothetical protein